MTASLQKKRKKNVECRCKKRQVPSAQKLQFSMIYTCKWWKMNKRRETWWAKAKMSFFFLLLSKNCLLGCLCTTRPWNNMWTGISAYHLPCRVKDKVSSEYLTNEDIPSSDPFKETSSFREVQRPWWWLSVPTAEWLAARLGSWWLLPVENSLYNERRKWVINKSSLGSGRPIIAELLFETEEISQTLFKMGLIAPTWPLLHGEYYCLNPRKRLFNWQTLRLLRLSGGRGVLPLFLNSFRCIFIQYQT